MNEFFNISNFLYYFKSILRYNNSGLTKRDDNDLLNINDYKVTNDAVYSKCLNVINDDEDWKYLLGINNEFNRHVLLGLYLVVFIYLLNTLVIYIKNIKQFMISIRGPSFCIMILVGCLILVFIIAMKRVNIKNNTF